MARPGKVWWNEGKGAWYSTIAGKKTRIASGDKSREEAEELWHQIHAKEIAVDLKDHNPLSVIFEMFMDGRTGKKSYYTYKSLLQSFLDFHKANPLRVRDLDTVQVTRWLNYQKWSASTKAGAIATLQAALNWAAAPERRLIATNPIAGMSKPPIRSRGAEAIIDPDDLRAMQDAAKPALKAILFALRQTGTRPVNLRRVTAADCRFDRCCIVLNEHKTCEKTGDPLLIPITEALRPLLQELCAKYPQGPIFRNSRGTPWQEEVLATAFRRLRDRLKLKGHPILYGYRHTTATDLLLQGVPDAKVASILGHRDTKMLYKHYGHLGRHIQTLASDLDRAINGSGETASSPPEEPPASDAVA